MTDTSHPVASAHDTPIVSVVIPAYNAAGFIARAIASVQAQTLQTLEIIVVDDVSTDDTLAVVSLLAEADARIRLIRSPQNGGPSAARNLGFAAAKGQWIAILDADDVYKPDRLATLVDRANAASLDMIADNVDLDDFHAKTIVPGVINALSKSPHAYMPLDLELFLKNDFVESGYQLGLMKPVYRSQFLKDHDLTYPTGYRHGEDSYFYSAILACGAKAEIAKAAFYIYTPTVGPISKKISEHSRTKPDYVKKAQSCEDFLARYGARISKAAARLVERRRARMLAFHEFFITLEKRKTSSTLATLRRLAAHPSSFQFLLPLVMRKVRARLPGSLQDKTS